MDELISFTSKFQEYTLIIHDGDPSAVDDASTSGGIVISYCPWCGTRLSESQRDSWFQEMERSGIDAWTGDIPAEFQDAAGGTSKPEIPSALR